MEKQEFKGKDCSEIDSSDENSTARDFEQFETPTCKIGKYVKSGINVPHVFAPKASHLNLKSDVRFSGFKKILLELEAELKKYKKQLLQTQKKLSHCQKELEKSNSEKEKMRNMSSCYLKEIELLNNSIMRKSEEISNFKKENYELRRQLSEGVELLESNKSNLITLLKFLNETKALEKEKSVTDPKFRMKMRGLLLTFEETTSKINPDLLESIISKIKKSIKQDLSVNSISPTTPPAFQSSLGTHLRDSMNFSKNNQINTIDDLVNQNHQLSSKLYMLENDISQLSQHNTNAASSLFQNTKMLSSEKKANFNLQNVCTQLREKVSKLQSPVKESAGSQSGSLSRLNKILAYLPALRSHPELVSVEIELRKEISKLENECEELKSRSEELENELKRKDSDFKGLEEKLSATREKIVILLENRNNIDHEVFRLKNSRNLLNSKIQEKVWGLFELLFN